MLISNEISVFHFITPCSFRFFFFLKLILYLEYCEEWEKFLLRQQFDDKVVNNVESSILIYGWSQSITNLLQIQISKNVYLFFFKKSKANKFLMFGVVKNEKVFNILCSFITSKILPSTNIKWKLNKIQNLHFIINFFSFLGNVLKLCTFFPKNKACCQLFQKTKHVPFITSITNFRR